MHSAPSTGLESYCCFFTSVNIFFISGRSNFLFIYVLSYNVDYSTLIVKFNSFNDKLFIYLIFTPRRKWMDFIFTIVLNFYCDKDLARFQIKYSVELN